MREVVLGPSLGNSYLIEEGLSENEEIATHGTFSIDAAAQLAGKPSMMNPEGGTVSTGHNHGSMEIDEHPPEDHSQHENMNTESDEAMEENMEHAIFIVSGNCEMCKATIEEAAGNLAGVKTAVWDIESKIIHLDYNKEKVNLEEIHKAIAAAGYDTEKVEASQEAYDNLPACCKYTR